MIDVRISDSPEMTQQELDQVKENIKHIQAFAEDLKKTASPDMIAFALANIILAVEALKNEIDTGKLANQKVKLSYKQRLVFEWVLAGTTEILAADNYKHDVH